MRAKKVVLCVGVDEDKLSMRAFLLETHGYRVVRAANLTQAMKLVEMEARWGTGVDLLLLHLPLVDVDRTLGAAKRRWPEMRSAITSEGGAYERTTLADAYLPHGAWPAAMLLEKIRVLTVRKTGPKKKPSGSEWLEERKKGVA